MSATNDLKLKAGADWTLATTHAFTNALADGSLSHDKMAGYLQQDYQFIDGFVRLLVATISHAPTLRDMVPAAQFLALITGSENTYFLRNFEVLGINSNAKPMPETEAFQCLMQEARMSGRYEIMLCVLVVAEWTYLDWASPFECKAPQLPSLFGEWITLHSGIAFSEVVLYLREQLDAAWLTLDKSSKAEVERIFIKSVSLERAFFDAAWQGFGVQE